MKFSKFVEATGHRTIAEITPNQEDSPDALPEALVAAAVVFRLPAGEVRTDNHLQWRSCVKDTNWHQSEGPGSSIKGRENHPVVPAA